MKVALILLNINHIVASVFSFVLDLNVEKNSEC